MYPPVDHRLPLSPARQALLVLAHLRCGDTFAQLAESFTVSATTVYHRDRAAVTILDGTIIPTYGVPLDQRPQAVVGTPQEDLRDQPASADRRVRQPAVALRWPARLDA